mgnify:FL=1
MLFRSLTDSAIKTADAGYLTRRLSDVSHDAIIRMEDCGVEQGIEISKTHRRDSFLGRILGRILVEDVKDGRKVVAKQGEVINGKLAQEIDELEGVESVHVHSPMTCQARKGLCQKCYGWDFSTREMVNIGVPVGIIAAQSIGEPGTQLTMRVKHSGGIVGLDVTQGLPRVEELLEARNPKVKALVAQVAGKVKISEKGDEKIITIKSADVSSEDEESYTVPAGRTLSVENGDLVHPGQMLTSGGADIQELLQLRGLLFAQQHLVDQVQYVYESQGITINDRHFEVIARKMGDKVKIEMSGDTEFLTGEISERSSFMAANDETMAAGGEPATAKVLLLGITRSSLFTDSWLSAASFQHTKHVLTDAASAGKVDDLEGLKENVIIGRLIPTSEERARID